jgi:RNA polymerase sigma-70 factor, ECF subfamily
VTDPTVDPTPADAELVRRAREGDREALGFLVSRHQGVVIRFLTGILNDEDAALDVAQETFLKALRSLDGFRGDASFRTWLLAIGRNEARGFLRRAKRSREQPLEDGPEPLSGDALPDEASEQSGELERIRSALSRLPEKQRLSVSLRLFDGLSFREIGAATDSSEGSARVNYHHGIRKLREWLDDELH